MKALLDEGVPKLLAHLLREKGCDVAKFPNAWKGLQNGLLLQRLQSEEVDCLITCDKNMIFQQSFTSFGISPLVLPTQDLAVLVNTIDQIAGALSRLEAGIPIIMERDGTAKYAPAPRND